MSQFSVHDTAKETVLISRTVFCNELDRFCSGMIIA